MADYIKREDAIKAVDNLCHVYYPANKAKLEAIPSADVQPVVHGKWYTKSKTRKGGHGEAYFVYGCSLCKKQIKYKTDFCPNCGARMDGGT